MSKVATISKNFEFIQVANKFKYFNPYIILHSLLLPFEYRIFGHLVSLTMATTVVYLIEEFQLKIVSP